MLRLPHGRHCEERAKPDQKAVIASAAKHSRPTSRLCLGEIATAPLRLLAMMVWTASASHGI